MKHLLRLRDRGYRDEAGEILIEGSKELDCAMGAKVGFREVYVCEALLRDQAGRDRVRRATEHGARLYLVAPAVYERVSYGERGDGILAVAPTPRLTLDGLGKSACPLLLVVEGVEKPGNLGAVLRLADAAGVHGVIVCEAHTDLFNPNAIRSSLGTIFTVPLAEATSEEALRWLRERQVRVVAASPHAAVNYTAVDYRRPTALVLGSEHLGLTPFWLEGADQRVRIPMRGQADSLNLAISASVLTFEAVRQREGSTGTAPGSDEKKGYRQPADS